MMDPTEFFCTVASPLVDGRCFPVVQPGLIDKDGNPVDATDAFPAIVFYRLGQETLTTTEGPFATGLAIRYECRSLDYDETLTLSERVITGLRSGGRLLRIGSGLDEYDEAYEIARRIQSVTLRI